MHRRPARGGDADIGAPILEDGDAEMINRLPTARLEVYFILSLLLHAGAVNGQIRIRLILQYDGCVVHSVNHRRTALADEWKAGTHQAVVYHQGILPAGHDGRPLERIDGRDVDDQVHVVHRPGYISRQSLLLGTGHTEGTAAGYKQ